MHSGIGWSGRGAASPLVKSLWVHGEPVNGVVGDMLKDHPEFVFRSIIGACTLSDIHPDMGCCDPWGESSYIEAGGKRRTKITHLVLEHVVKLATPVPVQRGALGLWVPDPATVAAVVDQVGPWCDECDRWHEDPTCPAGDDHYHCPDGWHSGDDLPCSCTRDCELNEGTEQ